MSLAAFIAYQRTEHRVPGGRSGHAGTPGGGGGRAGLAGRGLGVWHYPPHRGDGEPGAVGATDELSQMLSGCRPAPAPAAESTTARCPVGPSGQQFGVGMGERGSAGRVPTTSRSTSNATRSPPLLAGSNSGDVLGKMISPQNLAIAVGAGGLAGQEGGIFRKVLGLEPVVPAVDPVAVVDGCLIAVHPAPRIEELSSTASAPVRSLVLVLAGGQARSMVPTRRRRFSWLRMYAFARSLHRRNDRHGMAVRMLRYRYRGWNEPVLHPVQDARWALAQLRDRHPGVPVVLLGHSMGGRVALRVADDAAVTAVCALAPWTRDGEPVAQLAHRSVVIAHGDRERVTDPRLSYRYAVRAKAVTGRVCRFDVLGDGHGMLRRARDWSALVSRFVEGELGVRDPDPLIEDAMRRPAPEGLRVPLPGRRSWPTGR